MTTTIFAKKILGLDKRLPIQYDREKQTNKEIIMGLDFDYFADLEVYEARVEYEAWLDEQEQEFLATIDDSPYCEEVVE
jgi:hypothetical protein